MNLLLFPSHIVNIDSNFTDSEAQAVSSEKKSSTDVVNFDECFFFILIGYRDWNDYNRALLIVRLLMKLNQAIHVAAFLFASLTVPKQISCFFVLRLTQNNDTKSLYL